MKDKAAATLAHYAMLAPGDLVVAGVSGGADSMALLAFLLSLSARYPLRVAVCHLNHRLRGAEADRDARLVEDFCRMAGVPFHLAAVDVAGEARRQGLSFEEMGRRMRYDFFDRVADGYAAQVGRVRIATAHTRSDAVETMLLALLRGSSIDGLCGIPPVRGRIIRPLIEVTRTEVEDYCRTEGIPFCEDSTNRQDDYPRNRIRHRVIPELRQINPALEETAARLMVSAACDRDYLDRQTEALLRAAEADAAGCLLDVLQKAHPALRIRSLAHLLRMSGCRCDHGVLARLESVVMGEARRAQLADGWMAVRRKDRLSLERSAGRPMDVWEGAVCPLAAAPGVVLLPDRRVLHLHPVKNLENLRKVQKNTLKFVLDCDKLYDNFVARTRRPGDRVKLVGRGGSKTLKNLFQEGGLTAEERARRLILADEGGIVWLEGFGAAERAAPDSRSTRMLLITVDEEGENE